MDDLIRLINDPPIEYRPELRWWLAEGLHTDETLCHEIDIAYRLGFGGMEFLAWTRTTSITPATAGARQSGCTTPRSSWRRRPDGACR
jgi:hypothetical protein